MGLIGNGEGHTLLILTDAESRRIRFHLEQWGNQQAIGDFDRGIMRGTAKLQEEFKAEQARKKGKK